MPLALWRCWRSHLRLEKLRITSYNVCYTKLLRLLVDDAYALLGSANLDPRSLRLNFEFCLEVYDRRLNETLSGHFDRIRESSRLVRRSDLDARPLPIQLRDALAKLFSPYL